MRRVFIEQKRNYAECGRAVHLSRLESVWKRGKATEVNRPYLLNVALGYPLHGETAHLMRIGQMKLLFDMRPVGFHCFWAQM